MASRSRKIRAEIDPVTKVIRSIKSQNEVKKSAFFFIKTTVFKNGLMKALLNLFLLFAQRIRDRTKALRHGLALEKDPRGNRSSHESYSID